VFTQPADLSEALLSDALSDGWGFRPASLSYLAVGFGSHHWLAADSGGLKLFVTVDDQAAPSLTRLARADSPSVR